LDYLNHYTNMKPENHIEKYLQFMFTSFEERLISLEKLLIEKEKPFLNVDEACYYLGIPKNTIYQYTSKNLLPYYKLGKRIFFKLNDLNNFVLDEKNKYKSVDEINSEKWKSNQK